MADNRIRFSISSVFNGEGFQKASTAVKNTAGVVKNAADGARNLSAELGQLGGAASKVSDGIGKVFSVFSAGGPVGIAVAAITTIIGLFVKWRQSIVEAREKHDEMMKSMAEGYENRLAIYAKKARDAQLAALQAVIDAGQKAIDKVEKLTGAYGKLADSVTAAARSQASLDSSIVDLNLATAGDAGGADAKRRREIQAKMEKAEIAYTAAMTAAQNAQAKANDAVGVLTRKREQLAELADAQAKMGKDNTKALDDLRRTDIELAAAQNALKSATNDLTRVGIEHEATTAALANEEQRLADEIAAREQAEHMARQAAINKANAERQAQEQIDRLTEKNRIEVEQMDRQIAAKEAYIESIKAAREANQRGMAADAQHTNGMFGPYNYQTNPDGTISDFEDWQRAQRFNGRAQRDANNVANRNKRLDQELDRLNNKDHLTDQEKRRKEQLEGFKKQRDDLAAQEAQKKRMEEERKRIIDKLGTDVSEIKKKLSEALEVK